MISDFATVKKVIRSILITAKHGMTLGQLERSYLEYEGRKVPLFGYPDTAALLYELHDTVYTV